MKTRMRIHSIPSLDPGRVRSPHLWTFARVGLLIFAAAAIRAADCAYVKVEILVKNVADLELSGRIDAFVFDKTGTITTRRLAITRLQPGSTVTAAELLRFVAGAEKFSTHPTARAR